MRAVLFLILLANPGLAETCRVTFDFSFDGAIGSLRPETPLTGIANFATQEALHQPGDGLSFTTEGTVLISGPNELTLSAHIVDMHISRTIGSLDYISFNAREVAGTLGGETINANPMLATWYGTHGTLPGLEFPAPAEWQALTKRRAIQMRLDGSGLHVFGKIGETSVTCE